MESSPTFIHIEASSTKQLSFPAEVYWGTIPSDGSTGYVINPEDIAKWKTWDTEFYYVHQITQDDLRLYGSHPSVVCEAINQRLSGKRVFSKEPATATKLLRELFSVVDLQQGDLTIVKLDELFLQMINQQSDENAHEVLARIKNRIAEEYPHYLCGGAFEALYYSEIWRGIKSYNHP